MAKTTSISFPNMFDPVRNRVSVKEDDASIVNRTRLLFLTDPTELYNSPEFGVGLRRYLWQYNNDNVKAMIEDRMVQQLKLYEPYVEAGKTKFADGLLFTGQDQINQEQNFNRLSMTVGLTTKYGDQVEVNVETSEQRKEFLYGQ